MWVETGTKSGYVVNLAQFDSVFVRGGDVLADKCGVEDVRETVYSGTTSSDADAALRRIRDALAEGRTYLSLREPEHDRDGQSESDSGEAGDPGTYCGQLLRDGRVMVPDWPTAQTVIRQAYNAKRVAGVSSGSFPGPFRIYLYAHV